jgi:hypothetical protein
MIEEWAKNAGIREVYGIDPFLLNDYSLSKTLDIINEHRSDIKTRIALQVAKSFQVPLNQIHWDFTSFHYISSIDFSQSYKDLFFEYSYEIIHSEEQKPKTVVQFVNETLLMKKRMLYGIYVIGTSTDSSEYPMDRVFSIFKEQYTVENANKILKGPVRLRPIFLHKQERIESLILVIFIALMAYYLLERTYYYHQREEQKKKSKKAEKVIKKMTARKLLFEFCWYSLGIIYIENQKILKPSELTKEQQEIFNTLGLPYPSTWLSRGP